MHKFQVLVSPGYIEFFWSGISENYFGFLIPMSPDQKTKNLKFANMLVFMTSQTNEINWVIIRVL